VTPVGDDWDDLATWWEAEAATDPAYAADVHPLLVGLLPPDRGRTIDLGCGEGQGMRLVEGDVVGVDRSRALAALASGGPVVVSELPSLAWCRTGAFDAAYSVYVVDLLEDDRAFFAETARIIRPGGALVVVINHPVYTAPGASPLMDADGEVLWRWGAYFERGSSREPAAHRTIRYFHRPLDALLNAAADSGWVLERLEERGLSETTIEAIPGYSGQERIPRLLGARWRNG
jgi:SAM-dependent methyltransferase